MLKFLRKPKFIKFMTMLLVTVFCINVAGCVGDTNGDNGVFQNRENGSIGQGANTVGYTVYAESTFDQMTLELLMGYLINGREFSLVIVPDKYVEADKSYKMSENNYLFSAVQAGVHKYDESAATFVNPEKKLLLYYVNYHEFLGWLNMFEKEDTFINLVMKFADKDVDLEDYSRYTCKKLVNMGNGLSADEFCDKVIQNETLYKSDNKTVKENPLFSNAETGGMILLFGYSSIQGYITYNDLENYKGSKVANSLVDACKPSAIKKCYNVNDIKPFDMSFILDNGYKHYDDIYKALQEHYTQDVDDNYKNDDSIDVDIDVLIDKYKNGRPTPDDGGYNEFVETVIGAYTEYELTHNGAAGYQRLYTTYNVLGSALLKDITDTYGAQYGESISAAKNKITTELNAGATNKDQLNAQISIIQTLESFDETAKKEALNIKLSVALYSRYSIVKDYPDTTNLVTGESYSDIKNISYNAAKEYIKGKDGESYLMLVTADGFVLDRGTVEDQKLVGGMETVLAELVRMDACPNATIAAEMFNMLANIKIAVGFAVAAVGVGAVAVAAIGLAVASVIAKLSVVALATPVPGGRIAALVLLAIAGIIAIGVGLYTLFQGLEDKARLKGMGASEENYCETYKATFKWLFESIELSIPVYHYKVPKETDKELNKNLALVNCDKEGKNCKQIQLYYYANVAQSRELRLEGAPILFYFDRGVLRDYVYGAATPSYIIEMLRLWGLLAMREIVYKTQVDWNTNTVSVSRTTNKNANTHSIKNIQYCLNLTYGKIENNDCVLSELHKPLYENLIYYNKLGTSQSYYSYTLPDISRLNINPVTEMDEYEYRIKNSAEYRFNEYIQNNITLLESPEQININLLSSIIPLSFEIKDNEGNVIETFTEGANLKIYYPDKGLYYVAKGANESTIYFADSRDDTTLTKLAVFSNDIDIAEFQIYQEENVEVTDSEIKFIGFNNIQNDDQTYSYTVIQENGKYKFTVEGEVFWADESKPSVVRKVDETYNVESLLNYIKGDVEFEYTEATIKIPFYFTAIVGESTLVSDSKDATKFPNLDKNSVNSKECKAEKGKYLYEREHNFLGKTWYTQKCLTAEQATSKDTPYESKDYTYYATSKTVGYITLYIEKGKTEILASANYLPNCIVE